MAGEIMRVLDDSLIFYLMEKYSGYSLSPEAILALLGNTMGTSVINNIDPNNTMTLDQLQRYAELHPSDPLPSSSDYFNQMDYEMEMMMADQQQQSSSLMKDTGNASLTAQLSYVSQINNYRSFGRRSPPNGPGGTGTGVGGGGKDHHSSHLPSLVGSSSLNSSSAFPSESGMSFARHGLNSRMNAPVTGFQPRSELPHDSRVSSANHLKTLAGGFRTQQGAALLQTLQQQKEGLSFDPLPNDQSHPWFTNRSSPYPGESGRKTPLVVLSSEHFRSVADEMGFSLPELMTTGFRDLQDQQEAADEEEYQDQQKIESAIGAMHEQLLEEGILPSLRPEKVLSKQQLTELGLKKKTVEDVFKQITGKDIRAVLSRAPTTRADEIKAKLARNNTMSASQLSLINDLLELDKEQQQSQQQSESGLPLTHHHQQPTPSISVDGFNDDDDSTTRGGKDSPSAAPLPAPLTSSPLPVTPSFKRALTLGSLHSIKEVKSTDSQDDFHLHKSSSSGPGGHLLGRGTGSRSNDENNIITGEELKNKEEQEKTITDSFISENNNSRPNSRPELRKSFTTPTNLLFHGSIISTPKDKERLEKLQIAESEKATQRLILPAARDPREKYKELLEEFPLIKESIDKDMEREKQRLMKSIHSNRRGSNNSQQQEDKKEKEKNKSSSSKDKKNNKNKKMTKEEFLLSKEFKEEQDQFPQKGTRSIKTREEQDQQVEERRTALNQTKHTSSVEKDRGEGGIDNIGETSHDNRLPPNPYNSWDQETQILNAGVASGAGLMLWRPRTLATGDGRYRVGRNHQGSASPIRPLPREGYSPLPNNNIGYLGVIHADNIYSKSKNRKTPFVSAT
jgi:hypothetical protein